jgi:hypothetical protein
MNVQETIQVLGVVSSQLYSQNATRKKIVLTPPIAGQRYTVSSQSAILDQGITVNGGGPAYVIDEETHGKLAQSTLNVVASAPMTVITYSITSNAG